jgi:hypothetical protein
VADLAGHGGSGGHPEPDSMPGLCDQTASVLLWTELPFSPSLKPRSRTRRRLDTRERMGGRRQADGVWMVNVRACGGGGGICDSGSGNLKLDEVLLEPYSLGDNLVGSHHHPLS